MKKKQCIFPSYKSLENEKFSIDWRDQMPNTYYNILHNVKI